MAACPHGYIGAVDNFNCVQCERDRLAAENAKLRAAVRALVENDHCCESWYVGKAHEATCPRVVHADAIRIANGEGK